MPQDNRDKPNTNLLGFYNIDGDRKLLKHGIQESITEYSEELVCKLRRIPEGSPWEQGKPDKALPPVEGQGHRSPQPVD